MRKETTKKFKINLMDILVILLILVCIISVVFRAMTTNQAKAVYTSEEYRLNFEIEDIKSSSFNCFDGHEGESVRIKSNGMFLGTLGGEFTRGVASFTYTEDKDGNTVKTEYYYPAPNGEKTYSEERCSISGYITVLGKMTNNGFFLNGETYLAQNGVLDIVTEHISVSIKITSIVEK